MGPLEAAVGVADVIRHEVTLFDPAFLLQRQLANTSRRTALVLRRPPPAVLGDEHHVVYSQPTWRGLGSRNRPS